MTLPKNFFSWILRKSFNVTMIFRQDSWFESRSCTDEKMTGRQLRRSGIAVWGNTLIKVKCRCGKRNWCWVCPIRPSPEDTLNFLPASGQDPHILFRGSSMISSRPPSPRNNSPVSPTISRLCPNIWAFIFLLSIS